MIICIVQCFDIKKAGFLSVKLPHSYTYSFFVEKSVIYVRIDLNQKHSIDFQINFFVKGNELILMSFLPF